MKVFLVVLFCSVFAGIAHAESRIVFLPGVVYFDYEETAEDGTFLDGETGPILGVSVNLENTYSSNIISSLYGGVYTGTVDYDGHAQPSGVPVKSDTKQNIYNVGIRVKFPLIESNFKAFFNVGYEFKRWERDIQPTTSPSIGLVSGLYEVYEWQEISLGADVQLNNNIFQQWSFYAGIFQTRDPDIVINLEADGDGKPKLFMGTDTGLQLSAQWMHAKNKSPEMGVKLTYKTWEFGRSNSEPISGGREITEPRSRTHLLFLELVVAIPVK